MQIKRASKTELDPTDAQRRACVQHAGAARWAYNWGLALRIAAYEKGEKTPYAMELHRRLNQLKRTDVPWMYDVSKCAPQEALRNLDTAYVNFFRRVELKKQGLFDGDVGFPKPKTKKHGLGSFRLTGTIRIGERHIQLPRLGKLRLKERGYLPVDGTPEVKVLSATVSEKAGRWFVAVQVEQTLPDPEPSDRPVAGVDLGLGERAGQRGHGGRLASLGKTGPERTRTIGEKRPPLGAEILGVMVAQAGILDLCQQRPQPPVQCRLAFRAVEHVPGDLAVPQQPRHRHRPAHVLEHLFERAHLRLSCGDHVADSLREREQVDRSQQRQEFVDRAAQRPDHRRQQRRGTPPHLSLIHI